jgi:hypothetical protein
VNVSGFSIGKPAYVDSLIWLLKDNPWAQGKLMFEITESSRMSDLELKPPMVSFKAYARAVTTSASTISAPAPHPFNISRSSTSMW